MSHFFKLTDAVAWVVPLRDGKRDYAPLIEKIRTEAKSVKYVVTPDETGLPLPGGVLSLEKLIEALPRLSTRPIT